MSGWSCRGKTLSIHYKMKLHN
uniref:Uncharacterized protein n=1 Tax=Arundo donax TaxID=35708 RepID=A0A0A9FC70_ARUDO